jgi:CBS domain-containing protein
MFVKECCNAEVVSCDVDTVVQKVAALMRHHHVGSVVVNGRDQPDMLLGIVTDRDIVVEAVAPELDVNTFTAGDIMNTPLVTVRENEDLGETLRLMRTHKIRRIVVVNENGGLYGIVSADDIIDLLARELQMITGAIVGQQGLEERLRK